MMVRRLSRFTLLLALLIPLTFGAEAVAYKAVVDQVMPDDDGELPMNGAGASAPDGDRDSKMSSLKDRLVSIMPFLERIRLNWHELRMSLFQ
jgi:hypothetical protein